ncbi:hypothetical protein E8E01_13070 [Methylorubrum populi]|nr:hypothetical protein E8E01_13070 [Methylorubrum populi]
MVGEGALLTLLLFWVAAVLFTERGPVKLTPPLVPYGASDQPSRAVISSAAMSPPLIRGR